MTLSRRSLKQLLGLSLVGNLAAIAYLVVLPAEQSAILSNDPTKMPRQSQVPVVDSANHSSQQYTDWERNTEENLNITGLAREANTAFKQLNFVLAFELFEQVDLQNPRLAMQLQDAWINKTYEWLKQQRFKHVQTVLDNVFIYDPYDQAWQLVHIAMQKALNNPRQAIIIYRELMLNTFDIKQEDWYLAQIHSLAIQTIKDLKEQQAWLEIIDFALWLLDDEPNYPPYLWALAQAYAHSENGEYALPYLQQLSEFAEYQTQVSALYQKIDGSADVEVIKLKKLNEHFLVNATINDALPVALMIDTGASLTVISHALYEQLARVYDVEIHRRLTLNTAGGLQQAFSIKVNHFAIGEHLINDMEIVVLDLHNFADSDGLLGMNFLKHFKFAIDQQNANLILEQSAFH